MVEGNSGVRFEARLALAAEHPDHDAYERGDKDKKIDCPNHVTHLIHGTRVRGGAVHASQADIALFSSSEACL